MGYNYLSPFSFWKEERGEIINVDEKIALVVVDIIKNNQKTINQQSTNIMATALIDTRKSILSQITDSWNQWRTTDEASELFPFSVPLATEFGKNDTPWTTKQSVLERNAVHANNLIRLYIALNIEVADRMSIWQFFEIQNGAVGKIKEQIQTLKRVAKVLKKQQQYGMVLSNSTDMFVCRGDCSLYELEIEIKLKDKKKSKKKMQ